MKAIFKCRLCGEEVVTADDMMAAYMNHPANIKDLPDPPARANWILNLKWENRYHQCADGRIGFCEYPGFEE